jgi:predicted outer membrane protein
MMVITAVPELILQSQEMLVKPGKKILCDVLEMNAREIAWLNTGINKGMDSELKSNAKKMLSDHEALRKELKDYAQKNNIMTPHTDTSNIVDITDKPGVEWDEEWADEVGDDPAIIE